jgi:hypothetical protein
MKKISLWLLLCLSVADGMTGCKNSDADAATGDIPEIFAAKLRSAEASGISAGENVPEWLSTKITEMETLYEKDLSIMKVCAFRCVWKNRTVYFISNNLASCILCEVYDEDGEKIIWSRDFPLNDFCIESENHELIYVFGDDKN